ncbi:hypothetical protein BLA60_20600 [Actinophytocola xinjiangensis]|uniref:Bacteriocin biosynthesis cyclodehydratase domain-containing protein n=1 Tax=Actinophytocola xinjiangensis TaxID=485602 RepID=A0A7Z1AYC0_9PSEU|nr:hypothetical protein [Actinophytocola xinjiangensis]OLF08997.1 hypothetical protein BLA60_20600 [Actinophytocola xinjiangensis]
MDHNLPIRPRIIPDLRIFRRRPDEVQVGLDSRLAAVLSGLPEPVAAALHQLDGRRRVDELVDDLGEHGPALRTALVALATRGLVADASSEALPLPVRLAGDVSTATMRAALDPAVTPGERPARDDPAARRGLAVTVQGDGRLAVAVACLLAGSGIGWVHVAAGGSVRPEDTGTGYLAQDVGRRRAGAAKDALARVDAAVRTTAPRRDRRPDLIVLADTLVHEPARIDELNAAGVPHLAVRMRDGAGIVGPLVVPGTTSCLRCADLHRCDRDERWPAIALQLAGQVQLADLAGTHATAALAAREALNALAWLRGLVAAPVVCAATIELDLGDTAVRHRVWPAHESCPCGAAPSCSNVAANTNDELRESRT